MGERRTGDGSGTGERLEPAAGRRAMRRTFALRANVMQHHSHQVGTNFASIENYGDLMARGIIWALHELRDVPDRLEVSSFILLMTGTLSVPIINLLVGWQDQKEGQRGRGPPLATIPA